MKKRIFLGALLILFIFIVFTGCNGMSINLSEDKFVVPVGEPISTDVSDYVRASDEMLALMTLDVSDVNTEVIGNYKAQISYEDEVKTFVNVYVFD